MEIKDVNNNATVQAMFIKAAANNASGQLLNSGFANLVNQLGDLGGSLAKGGDTKVALKDVKSDDKASAIPEKTEVKKDKPAKKIRAAEKNVKSVVRQNERKQSGLDSAPLNVAQDSAAPEAPKVINNAVETAPVMAADAAPVVQPLENAEPVMRDLQVTLLGDDAAPIAAMNGDEIVLLPEAEVNLDVLAQTPVVSVLDDASGEIVTMSGAEFAAKLQQASDNGQLYIAPEYTENGQVALQPAKISAHEDRDFSSDLQNVLPEQNVEYADADLAAQAQILDNKSGDVHKVRVSVEVKEDQVALADDAKLVRDGIVLEEIVNAAIDESAVEQKVKTTDAQTPVSAQPQSAQPAVSALPNGVAASVMAPGLNAEMQNSAKIVQVAGVDGVATAETSGGHALNLAAGNNVAAENRSHTSETSFRDIYKGMSKEVVDQVKVNITKSAVKGVDSIDIKLKPEDLGHIQIKMQISKDGKLQAHIVASRPETMEILQSEVQNLEKAFQDAGFDTDAGSFSFSFQEGAESGREQDRNAELRNFIGNVLEQDSAEDAAGNDNLYGWTAEGGLNIRV